MSKRILNDEGVKEDLKGHAGRAAFGKLAKRTWNCICGQKFVIIVEIIDCENIREHKNVMCMVFCICWLLCWKPSFLVDSSFSTSNQFGTLHNHRTLQNR